MRTFVSAFGKTDSKHTRGAVVQLVRMPACHAGGRGFESLPHRIKSRSNPGLFAMWKGRFCKLKNLQNEPSTSVGGYGLGIFLDEKQGERPDYRKNYGIPKILLGYPDFFVSMNLKRANCL